MPVSTVPSPSLSACSTCYGAPIYVRHEVVHNRFVVEGLKQRGAIFIEDLDEVPDGATLIFSAHGVAQAVRAQAQARGFRLFDATCPLVTKVHLEVARHCKAGCEVVLIGHRGHPEVEGTMGQCPGGSERDGGLIHLVESAADVAGLPVRNPEHLAYVTQTTLSVDDTTAIVAALRERFPKIQGPKRSDICYATQNRQDAVKELAARCDLLLVVGSANSSNSNRLRELAEKQGCTAYLIDGPEDIRRDWLGSGPGPADRPDRRGLGPRGPGRAGHRPAARVGRRGRRGTGRHPRAGGLPPAPRTRGGRRAPGAGVT